MFEALQGRREVDISGTKVNPRLHLSMHEIVVNQLWDGIPPETWEAAQRLLAQGHDRHEVLHMLAEVASAVAFRALHDGPSATGGASTRRCVPGWPRLVVRSLEPIGRPRMPARLMPPFR